MRNIRTYPFVSVLFSFVLLVTLLFHTPVAFNWSDDLPSFASSTKSLEVISSKTARKQHEIVVTAEHYLGARYKYGASPSAAPNVFDCSSFVQYVFKHNGIRLPRSSREQSRVGNRVAKVNLREGDLLFFRDPKEYSDGRIGHVAIYIGGGKIIHALPRRGVIISKWTKSRYWLRNYLFARRVK